MAEVEAATMEAVTRYHLDQHTSAIVPPEPGQNTPLAYVLVVQGCAVKDGRTVQNGRGIFTGPLKTMTCSERATLYQTFRNHSPNLKERLESRAALEGQQVVIISICSGFLNGQSHTECAVLGVEREPPQEAPPQGTPS